MRGRGKCSFAQLKGKLFQFEMAILIKLPPKMSQKMIQNLPLFCRLPEIIKHGLIIQNINRIDMNMFIRIDGTIVMLQ